MLLKIQRFFQTLSILGWGVACLYWGIFANFEKLLHPMFQPAVIGAGIAFILLGVMVSDPPSEGKCTHDLSWSSLGLGGIGLILVLFCRPEGLNMKTMMNRESGSGVVDSSGRDQTFASSLKSKSSEQRVDLDMLDLFYVAGDPKLREAIQGKQVALIGQVAMKRGFSLMRMMMWCCVADARPVMVEMRGIAEGSLKEGDWIEVEGTLEFVEEGKAVLPVLKALKTRPVSVPEEIYLY
jgi:uncharacterized repeat protein (TIGR03943 family)